MWYNNDNNIIIVLLNQHTEMCYRVVRCGLNGRVKQSTLLGRREEMILIGGCKVWKLLQ